MDDSPRWSWRTIVGALAVLGLALAALLLLYGPTAHYIEVYRNPTAPDDLVGVAHASATTGCMSQLARWEEQPSRVAALSNSGSHWWRDRGYEVTDAFSAGNACERAIEGRDHLALALVIGAVILAAVSKRRATSAAPPPPEPTSH